MIVITNETRREKETTKTKINSTADWSSAPALIGPSFVQLFTFLGFSNSFLPGGRRILMSGDELNRAKDTLPDVYIAFEVACIRQNRAKIIPEVRIVHPFLLRWLLNCKKLWQLLITF